MPPQNQSNPFTPERQAASLAQTEVHKDVQKQQEDLLHFLELQDPAKLTPAQKEHFEKARQRLDEFNQTGDVEQIRKAGVTEAENRNNFNYRHALLASRFLKKSQSNLNVFQVDFSNNQLAEWKVGAGDMLPPNVLKIRVTGADGNPKTAIRGQNPLTRRIGYFYENDLKVGSYTYAPVHTGDTIEIVETIAVQSEGNTQTMKEHVEVFQHGAAGESASEPHEQRFDASTHQVYPDNAAALQASQGRVRQSSSAQRRDLAGNIGTEPAATPVSPERAATPDRQRIVDKAKSFIGVARPEFRTPEVQGGTLACAKVASTILYEAGFIDAIYLNCDATRNALLKKGWRAVPGKPGNEEPGDVVIWGAIGAGVKDTPNGPQYSAGHKHIGIVDGADSAVNNSSSKRMPVQSRIYTGRPVEVILKPPTA